jgi:hypothetical protein
MIRNYYKTATRSIGRSRFHSAINIFGLATGIAFVLLVGAYVWNEGQVNTRLAHADRQFFLYSQWKNPGMGVAIAGPGELAKALKENYPSLVANYYRFDGVTSNVSMGDKHFREGMQLGDSTLLTMYGFPLLHGDSRTAFADPFSVVITAGRAMKYFGRTDVVGQSLAIENFSGSKKDFRITGVMAKPFRNSVTWLNEDNDNQFFIPSSCLSYFGRNMSWQNVFIVSYVELQKGVSPKALSAPIAHLLKVNAPQYVSDNLEVSVIPLSAYYLSSDGGTVQKMLYTLSWIAFFILLMAVINFVNMSVSRSGSRMKEIGIRKVLGSLRRQLVLQFLTESIMLTGIATAIALVLYWLSAPWFSVMLGKEIPPLSALPGYAWIIIPLFAVFLGCVAGLYPAFMLSSLPSVDSLKGNKGSVRENIGLRKGLVSFQFAMATIVLVGAIIISQQISLFFSDRLGYDKEYVLSAQLPRDWTLKGVQHMETVRNEFSTMPRVKDASLSYERPDGGNIGNIGIFRASSDSAHAIVSQ